MCDAVRRTGRGIAIPIDQTHDVASFGTDAGLAYSFFVQFFRALTASRGQVLQRFTSRRDSAVTINCARILSYERNFGRRPWDCSSFGGRSYEPGVDSRHAMYADRSAVPLRRLTVVVLGGDNRASLSEQT